MSLGCARLSTGGWWVSSRSATCPGSPTRLANEGLDSPETPFGEEMTPDPETPRADRGTSPNRRTDGGSWYGR